ncbi:response regulator [candidate division KSB1 bacterium]|nr:response regulator [Candidatus Aminicenantes bacterium]RQW03641.1 MAG: response regulator [candidate division KSB1 bacterium]
MGENKIILIVDDDKEICLLLKEFLEERGFEIRIAHDGQKAIELAENHVPDLVITDLLLPKEHGVDVMREIKDRFFTPIIAISGIYHQDEVRKKIDDIYLEGFYEKPLNLEALYKGIQAILNE